MSRRLPVGPPAAILLVWGLVLGLVPDARIPSGLGPNVAVAQTSAALPPRARVGELLIEGVTTDCYYGMGCDWANRAEVRVTAGSRGARVRVVSLERSSNVHRREPTRWQTLVLRQIQVDDRPPMGWRNEIVIPPRVAIRLQILHSAIRFGDGGDYRIGIEVPGPNGTSEVVKVHAESHLIVERPYD